MPGTGDLIPLLRPATSDQLGFRQGVVEEWNPVTGSNTIRVGTSALNNLPVLNTSDAGSLIPGDVVGLLTIKGQFFILGRVTVVGGVNAGGALGVGRLRASYDTSSFAVLSNVTWSGTSPSVDVHVGKSGKLEITLGCQMDASSPGSSTNTGWGGRMAVDVSGPSFYGASSQRALVFRNGFSQSALYTGTAIWRASYTHLYEDLVPGLYTLTARYTRTDAASTLSVADRTLIATPY